MSIITEWDGTVYPSRAAASRKEGVPYDTMRNWLDERELIRLPGKHGHPKPISIRGVSYTSMAEAGRALGVSRATVSRAAQLGSLDNVGTGKQRSSRKAMEREES